MYEKNPAESDQGGGKGRKAPRRHLGCVADRAAKQGERSGYLVRLVVVERRHFRHSKVAIAIRHGTGQGHFEGDLTQRARYIKHLLIVHVRCVVAERERNAGCVKASRDRQAVAASNRIDLSKAGIAATGCDGQHLRDLDPVADKLRATNATARVEPAGIDGIQAIEPEGISGKLVNGIDGIACIFPARGQKDFIAVCKAVGRRAGNCRVRIGNAGDSLCRCKGFGE